MENVSNRITKISGIISITVGWLLLIFLYSTYAFSINKTFSFNMWFIYFIFLTWTVVSLVVVYKTLTYGSNFPNGYDTVSAKHLTKRENSDLNKKFGLFLLGTAIVAVVAGTFLSLAITGVNLSYRAYYISGLVQYVSVAMFIILAHAGVIIYSVNKKNFNNSMATGNAKSQDI